LAGTHVFIKSKKTIIAKNRNFFGFINYCALNLFLPKSKKTKLGHYQNSRALDWVWPQPATPEEIQKYYAEQAKKSK
jgi:hypothetical protein